MQNTQAQYLEELKALKTRQDELWSNQNNFYQRMRTQQGEMAKEIEEIKKFQVNQTLMAFRRDPLDKLEMRMDNQHKEIVKMRAQIKEWTKNGPRMLLQEKHIAAGHINKLIRILSKFPLIKSQNLFMIMLQNQGKDQILWTSDTSLFQARSSEILVSSKPQPKTPVTPAIIAPTPSLPPKKGHIQKAAGEGTSKAVAQSFRRRSQRIAAIGRTFIPAPKEQEVIAITSDSAPEPAVEDIIREMVIKEICCLLS
ncbi:hypothetical protein PIB30_054863 [Stylosanthes scabra]|uniref:Uncharacterized protein n=1 Tax=Stylosanthes scabra TaxID=79078 RepID=A0ABU6VJ33_9FABA|nr:hypothetical protein [Stylosanthes scabra]